MAGQSHIPTVATRSLFAVTAVLWLVVAGLVVTRTVSIGRVSDEGIAVLVAAMTLAALVMMALARWSLRGNRWVDTFAVAAAVVNVLLTFTDQIGVYDLLYLGLSLALLITLLWALIAGRTSLGEGGDARTGSGTDPG